MDSRELKHLGKPLYGNVDVESLYICRPIPFNDKYPKWREKFAPVAVLTRYTDEDCNELWTIAPIWENYKSPEEGGYGFDEDDDEIYSVNMELHKDRYDFYNYIPGIVAKRMPPKRHDAEYFRMINIQAYDEIDILRATKGLCNDDFVFIDGNDIDISKPFQVPEIKEYGMEGVMFGC